MLQRLLTGFVALPLAALLSGCSVKVTGTYSTLAFAAGHAQGIEVFIVRGPGSRYYAMVQCADGELGRPVLLEASIRAEDIRLPVIVDAGARCPAGAFVGLIGSDGIRGAFAGAGTIMLPRKASAWQ
jgi:hypothetical protein